ncbi:UDP-forming cellulose synthase catalytic subunit [Zobellella sp. DQSA1]|uniref:UDP-forming cellulose synthase catalytic subunit n=1 Tax=Zobellella sp. DQSA1 TaxID=3342386 RepID=UPI0035C06C8F
MNWLLGVLSSQAQLSLVLRYRGYRERGSSSVAALLCCGWGVLAWLFLRLESPWWQRVRAHRNYWFPHISPERPRIGDSLRYLLQSLWLLLVYPVRAGVPEAVARVATALRRWRAQARFPVPAEERRGEKVRRPPPGLSRASCVVLGICALLLALLSVSQPFDLQAQVVFVLILWAIAMVVRRLPGRFAVLMMIVLSLTISCRYLWWRYSSTLNWNDPLSLTFGLLLLAAETYSWLMLVLGYFQSVWPLNRRPVPLMGKPADWPTVDILIPTYNEPLSVVKPTLYGALGIDWPRDKLNIYLLDDGNRAEFREFAAEAGVHYIARPTHEHAKAGNINYALRQAKGEFVAIFDCDHLPTRTFLQLTMGWFQKDSKLAMLQTPHYFFSPDPFERNLKQFGQTPNEGALFYGVLQDGNDMWDASFFCGSCAIIRRSALDDVGGVAVETVTEDAHTSLRLHRKGYTSAYIRIPLAAGLATESLSAHIGQRIRWARGMVQIFRLDNPLLGRGLKWPQRLCYASAMLHFLSGIPRLIFLTAPLAFLLLHAYIIYAPAVMILIYVLPYMVHASITNSRIQGKYRYSFWSEIYESVLAWYIARPTTVALLNPHKGKFNVTAKGGLVDETHVDWTISRPYIILILLNLAGLLAGFWRLWHGPADEIPTVLLSQGWVIFNMLILGGAIAVAIEHKQVRQTHRVSVAIPVALKRQDGHLFPCILRDYSDGGAGLEVRQDGLVQVGDRITLLLRRGQLEYPFAATVVRSAGTNIGLQMDPMSREQHIDFIQCTFARADTWVRSQRGFTRDKPLASLGGILSLGWRGFHSLGSHLPAMVRLLLGTVGRLVAWLWSFLPVPPDGEKRRLSGPHTVLAQP